MQPMTSTMDPALKMPRQMHYPGDTMIKKSSYQQRHFDQKLDNRPYNMPDGCPTNLKYFPPHLRNELVTWEHSVPGSEHPGTQRTSFFDSLTNS